MQSGRGVVAAFTAEFAVIDIVYTFYIKDLPFLLVGNGTYFDGAKPLQNKKRCGAWENMQDTLSFPLERV